MDIRTDDESMAAAGIGPGTGTESLDRHISTALAVVAAAARIVAAPTVAASVVYGFRGHHFVHTPLAVACYLTVLTSGIAYLVALLRGVTAGWLNAADVAVVAAAMLALRFAVDGGYFEAASDSALEPFATAVLVGVAITASTRRLIGASVVVGVAYIVTMTRASAPVMINAITDLSWQLGIALVCLVGAQRLRRAGGVVSRAARQVVDEREALAEQRGRDLERRRHQAAQQRRYLELHDGPLALLTAMSRPAPAGHPDPDIRQRCAANASLLRGLLSAEPDQEGAPAPDLQLALAEAGADCAAVGLRVRYQFGALPETLPDPVVAALRGAARAALNNVLAHSGGDTAWVTAEGIMEEGRSVVTVDIVDRGTGFDTAAVATGLGLPGAIIGRMAAAGGAAEIDTAPGAGTWIRLRWPA